MPKEITYTLGNRTVRITALTPDSEVDLDIVVTVRCRSFVQPIPMAILKAGTEGFSMRSLPALPSGCITLRHPELNVVDGDGFDAPVLREAVTLVHRATETKIALAEISGCEVSENPATKSKTTALDIEKAVALFGGKIELETNRG